MTSGVEFHRYHDGTGYRLAVPVTRAKERKWTHLILIEDGQLRRKKVPLSELRYCVPMDLSDRVRKRSERSWKRLLKKAPKSVKKALKGASNE